MRGTLLADRRGVQRFRQLAITAVKSSSIKLLLQCCIAFTVLVVGTRTSDFMGWTDDSDSFDQFPLQGKIFEIGSTGISSLEGHSEKRTRCVNRFVAEFGRMPLFPATVKAVDSRSAWFCLVKVRSLETNLCIIPGFVVGDL